MPRPILVAILAASGLLSSVFGTGAGATPPVGTPAAAVATPFICPVTQPNGKRATDAGSHDGDFGNDALWTNLWMWGHGVVRVPNDAYHVGPDGSLIDLKWAWHRFVPGRLTIEGRRLDAQAPPLTAWIPDGYGIGRGFQVTGLTFPTQGCWEVTGRVGGGSLTFVTLVVPPVPMATVGDGTPPAS